jgi:hypothetical protein
MMVFCFVLAMERSKRLDEHGAGACYAKALARMEQTKPTGKALSRYRADAKALLR